MKAAAAGDEVVAASVWPKVEEVFLEALPPPSSHSHPHQFVDTLQIIAKIRQQQQQQQQDDVDQQRDL
jgi:hypothetical protein